MDKAAIIDNVERTLAASLPDVELVDVEVAGGRGSAILRVFIDHPDGVDHELCSRVTALLLDYLKDYTVEVSSPGLERRLRKQEHFQGAVGKKINVRTFGPVEGRRNFTGFLISADGETLRMEIDGEEARIPLDQVASAKTIFEFEPEEQPRGGSKKKRRR